MIGKGSWYFADFDKELEELIGFLMFLMIKTLQLSIILLNWRRNSN